MIVSIRKRVIKTTLTSRNYLLLPQFRELSSKKNEFVFELKDNDSKKYMPTTSTVIDKSTLFDPKFHLQDKPNFSDKTLGYEAQTPLCDEFIRSIGVQGPLSTAYFMQTALSHPKFGYYTSSSVESDEDDNSAKIGRKGDFITAPEISQVFGESIFIFFLSIWRMSRERGKSIEWIEIGPGKGTLIYDILYTAIKNFPLDFSRHVKRVNLVEISPKFRIMQREMLSKLNSISQDFEIVFLEEGETIDDNSTNKHRIYVSWYANLSEVPIPEKANMTSQFVICQELFDTSPIYSFEKSKDGWRERMVDVDIDSNPAYKTITSTQERPRLRFVTSKAETETVNNLLKPPLISQATLDDAKCGSIIEISSEALILIEEIKSRIQQSDHSAALIIDYGYYENQVLDQTSIRAFQQHKIVHPLSTPGRVDLTADVNFAQLQRPSSHPVQILGPVTQMSFLSRLGIVERVVSLIDNENTTEKQAEELVEAVERLIGDSKGMMGITYKVMALLNNTTEENNVPGF